MVQGQNGADSAGGDALGEQRLDVLRSRVFSVGLIVRRHTSEVDPDPFDVTSGVAAFEAVAAILESNVVGLMDHAEHRAADLGCDELFRGFDATSEVIQADVQERADAVCVFGAGVEGDDMDAGGLGFGNRLS